MASCMEGNRSTFLVYPHPADIVAWLLERGADPNKNSDLGGPLRDAATLGNFEVCELLIGADADPNSEDSCGDRPLHCAARRGNATLCELLITAGADVNAEEMCGDTAWDVALPRKLQEIRSLLESHGGKTGKPDDWDVG